jgi:hypothetical protein
MGPGVRRLWVPAFAGTTKHHTFSNGTLIAVVFSIHSGTGRFFERMNAGLNSFD